jgi:hypothetical protein
MLPKWFKREMGSENNKYMSINRPDGSWSITWESASPNASRWGTYNAIFLDEFAFQSNATAINSAAASATPCRIFVSTPNGKWNEFYRLRKISMPYKDEYWQIVEPQLKWLRYLRSDHPLYTQEWYNNKIKWMDKQTIWQELNIDYNTAVIGRVYPDFPTESEEIKYNPELPLYVAIDNSHWGTDPNAVLIAQPDWVYRNLIDYVEYNSTPEDSAYFLSAQPKWVLQDNQYKFLERYKTYNRKKAIFIADPYDTMSAMGNSTILDDYRKVWINLMIPQERRKQEQILKTRTNLYRFRYNKECEDFADMILNARYPERKEDSNSTKAFVLPVHNQTSHARTALEYFATWMCENPSVKKQRVVDDPRPQRDMITWKLFSRIQPQRMARNYISWALR